MAIDRLAAFPHAKPACDLALPEAASSTPRERSLSVALSKGISRFIADQPIQPRALHSAPPAQDNAQDALLHLRVQRATRNQFEARGVPAIVFSDPSGRVGAGSIYSKPPKPLVASRSFHVDASLEALGAKRFLRTPSVDARTRYPAVLEF